MVRAAYTCTTASGVAAGSGASPTDSRLAVRQSDAPTRPDWPRYVIEQAAYSGKSKTSQPMRRRLVFIVVCSRCPYRRAFVAAIQTRPARLALLATIDHKLCAAEYLTEMRRLRNLTCKPHRT